MRIIDWSSDVCSSDLARQQPHFPTEAALAGHDVLLGAALDQIGRKAGIWRRERAVGGGAPAIFGAYRGDRSDQPGGDLHRRHALFGLARMRRADGDRKSGEKGKSVSVRVDLDGRHYIKQKYLLVIILSMIVITTNFY